MKKQQWQPPIDDGARCRRRRRRRSLPHPLQIFTLIAASAFVGTTYIQYRAWRSFDGVVQQFRGRVLELQKVAESHQHNTEPHHEPNNVQQRSLLMQAESQHQRTEPKSQEHAIQQGRTLMQADEHPPRPKRLRAHQEVATTTTEEEEPPTTFVGFLRVPKTGSTSLLSFLSNEGGLKPWTEFFYKPTQFLEDYPAKEDSTDMALCVYGPPAIAASVQPQDVNSSEYDDVNDVFWDYGVNECGHMRYRDFLNFWEISQDYAWNPPKQNALDDSNTSSSVLKTFTMIREPLHRLHSLFDYTYQGCDEGIYWRGIYTDEQYDQLCHHEFATLLETLGNTPKDEIYWYFYQHMFLSRDLYHAIAIMHGDSPKAPQVLVLLNECYEASLQIMQHKFGLAEGSVESFIQSDHSMLNRAKHKSVKQTLSPKTEESYQRLLKKTKKLFADDYKFYNAAIEQFKLHLKSAKIDPATLSETCRATLYNGK